MSGLLQSNAAEMYRRMQRIRQFEATASALLARGEFAGGLYTTSGQQAAIVGACLALSNEDYMVRTHRSHGHPIGKGMEAYPGLVDRTACCAQSMRNVESIGAKKV
jgi:TPP-dependent pyruvate/acetoin dehydrogenase alpha subunit